MSLCSQPSSHHLGAGVWAPRLSVHAKGYTLTPCSQVASLCPLSLEVLLTSLPMRQYLHTPRAQWLLSGMSLPLHPVCEPDPFLRVRLGPLLSCTFSSIHSSVTVPSSQCLWHVAHATCLALLYNAFCMWPASLSVVSGLGTRPLTDIWNIAVYPEARKCKFPCPMWMYEDSNLYGNRSNSHWTHWVTSSPVHPSNLMIQTPHCMGKGAGAFMCCSVVCKVGLNNSCHPCWHTPLQSALALSSRGGVFLRCLNLSWLCDLIWPKDVAKRSKSPNLRLILGITPPRDTSFLPHQPLSFCPIAHTQIWFEMLL